MMGKLDFSNKKIFKLKQESIENGINTVSNLLIENEQVIGSYSSMRDKVVFTNKRMLLGRKKFFGRYYYTSMTPDMLNDFEIRANILFGLVEVDTVKEHFIINCLDKRSLKKIEDALSKYLVDEKIKYMKEKKDSK